MVVIGIIFSALAVFLAAVSWLIRRGVFQGTLCIVTVFGFLASVTSSFWKVIFGGLSALVAIFLLFIAMKQAKP